MTTTRVEPPSFSELPLLAGLHIAHAWEVFGPYDELGTLNLIDPPTVRAGLDNAVTGERIGLALASDEIDPQLWGRMPLGELFDLDVLAARCADDGRWTFAFTAAPLALVGGVGSPADAVAIR